MGSTERSLKCRVPLGKISVLLHRLLCSGMVKPQNHRMAEVGGNSGGHLAQPSAQGRCPTAQYPAVPPGCFVYLQERRFHGLWAACSIAQSLTVVPHVDRTPCVSVFARCLLSLQWTTTLCISWDAPISGDGIIKFSLAWDQRPSCTLCSGLSGEKEEQPGEHPDALLCGQPFQNKIICFGEYELLHLVHISDL